MSGPPRLAVLADYADEGWISMDLCADMLFAHLPCTGPDAVVPTLVRPSFRRLFSGLPSERGRRLGFNADRIYNRFVRYPRHARRLVDDFDVFHVVDHSYAQLVHALPRDRVGIYCHDIDPFRCLVDPSHYPRPYWFRLLAKRMLAGLQRAAIVFHNSLAVREDLVRFDLVDPHRLIHVPLGVSAEFTFNRSADEVVPHWLDGLNGHPSLLHVGSCVPRKRIDVLIDVLARVRTVVPDVLLMKVGGEFSAEHRAQIGRLNLADAIKNVRGVSRRELAETYRQAGAVLVTSDAEGFGLPVIEAMSCGAPVIASDIPALREAGGHAAVYAPVGDIDAWADLTVQTLNCRDPAKQAERLAWSKQFSWSAHAATIATAYHGLL